MSKHIRFRQKKFTEKISKPDIIIHPIDSTRLVLYDGYNNSRKHHSSTWALQSKQPEDVEQMSIAEYDQRGTRGEGFLA